MSDLNPTLLTVVAVLLIVALAIWIVKALR